MHLTNWPYYQLWLIVKNLSWDLPIALKMQICKCRFNNISRNIQNKFKVMQSEWHYALCICNMHDVSLGEKLQEFLHHERCALLLYIFSNFYTKQVKSNQSQAPSTYNVLLFILIQMMKSCLLAINSTINLNMQVTHLRNIWNFAN